MSFTLFILLEQ